MTQPLEDRAYPTALDAMSRYHTDVVEQVQHAVANHPVVIIGMAQNPHVRHARKALQDANIEFEYIEFGSYLSQWRPRLAIKLWSGWPTYPQVFVQGKLLGGYNETRKALQNGSLIQHLSNDSA